MTSDLDRTLRFLWLMLASKPARTADRYAEGAIQWWNGGNTRRPRQPRKRYLELVFVVHHPSPLLLLLAVMIYLERKTPDRLAIDTTKLTAVH